MALLNWRLAARELRDVQMVDALSSRITNAMSLSSMECDSSNEVMELTCGVGRRSTGTSFWMRCGWFTYDTCDDRYPGSPYAYGSRFPSSVEL